MSRARERVADWFGLNRATVAVLVVIGCLGLSEEVWSNFLPLHFRDQSQAKDAAEAVLQAAMFVGLKGFLTNLLEGVGYMVGGTLAHRMGARIALAVSALPMTIGFSIMLIGHSRWASLFGALLMTNWEPLSVPATFDVVGSEVPKNRRTIAFAVQSIQKRLPKVIGPLGGAIIFTRIGYWGNLTTAFALVGLSVILQLALTSKMKPKSIPDSKASMKTILREMPKDLRLLLSAEIFIRWGDWFARDFALLYVVTLLATKGGWTDKAATDMGGSLMAIMNITALMTYVPMAKWIDRARSPKPFIGTTFFLFALFPLSLVFLPRLATVMGLPMLVGLVITYIVNGLRELGEPARKALISGGFPPEIRARAVGLYWGLRSFAFCPAPLVAAFLWWRFGPDVTFLIGGAIGLAGTLWFAISQRRATPQST